MSEMVERVAKAILAAQLRRQYVGKIVGVTAGYEIDRIWPEFAEEARAAIAAMREPTDEIEITPEMIRRAYWAAQTYYAATDITMFQTATFVACWLRR